MRQVRPEDRAQPHPLYAVWEITLKCDLGCKHCGSRAGKERDDELSTEECLDIVEQLSALGLREVTLIGGEAYLREDWDVIARSITDRGMACGMTTGARSLNDDRVKRAVDAGIRTISISLDGLERTHDLIRGARGSFRSAIEAAERVSKSGIALANNTQINRLSLPELPAISALLISLGSTAWQIQLTVPMGRGADRSRLLLEPYEMLALYPLLVWIKRERIDGTPLRLFAGNNIGYFGPYESSLRFGGERGAHWGGCPAGEWSIGLEADGKIKACPSLPSVEYTGGNTRVNRIADALAAAPELTFLKQRTPQDLWGYCRSCYYADVCKAGCTWTSQVLLGKSGNNPYCIHRAIEQEKSGLRERLVKTADAPGLPFDQGCFEVVEEPLPADEAWKRELCGFDWDTVIRHPWQSGSLRSEEEMRSILALDPPRRLKVIV